jgi:hypothetical protein
MKGLLGLVITLLVIAVLVESFAIGGAWVFRRQGKFDQEIHWLESMRPVLGWDKSYERQIDRLYRDRIRRELDADHLDKAVHALRLARTRAKSQGGPFDSDLVSLGIEAFTRAADRLESHGRLTLAADWDDSLFVFAVRAPQPHHRFAAVAAFVEGLDLRSRAGEPCAALAHVEWAKKGLGGEIPGFQPSVEEDLQIQCLRARRNQRR